MLKSFRMVLLSGLVLALCSGSAFASTVLDVDGKQWMSSQLTEKLAFLYGASSVVAIEVVVGEKSNDKPSIFVQKWMSTFGNDDITDVCNKLDAWYTSHPDQQKRHVFDVLWYEFMAPEQKK